MAEDDHLAETWAVLFWQEVAAKSHVNSQQGEEMRAYCGTGQTLWLTGPVQNEVGIRIDRSNSFKRMALLPPIEEIRRCHRPDSAVGELRFPECDEAVGFRVR